MSTAIMEFTRTCGGEPLNDGSHIIIVDYTRWSELTFLPSVQTFCAMLDGEKIDNDYASIIQDRLEDLVHDKEVMKAMFSLEDKLEEYFYNGKYEGKAEGKAEGKQEAQKEIIAGAIRGMYSSGLPVADIAKNCDIMFSSIGTGLEFWKPIISAAIS